MAPRSRTFGVTFWSISAAPASRSPSSSISNMCSAERPAAGGAPMPVGVTAGCAGRHSSRSRSDARRRYRARSVRSRRARLARETRCPTDEHDAARLHAVCAARERKCRPDHRSRRDQAAVTRHLTRDGAVAWRTLDTRPHRNDVGSVGAVQPESRNQAMQVSRPKTYATCKSSRAGVLGAERRRSLVECIGRGAR